MESDPIPKMESDPIQKMESDPIWANWDRGAAKDQRMVAKPRMAERMFPRIDAVPLEYEPYW
jgi:hypothetical protein